MQVQAKVEKQRRFDWFALVIAEFGICCLGHFAVLAILSLYFVHTLNLPIAQAGALLLFASLCYRFPRIFLAPLVDRLPMHQATFLALFLTSLGYLGMAVIRTPLLVMPLLLVVGVGHGTNALLVKTLAAHSGSSDKSGKSPFLRYASLSTALNLGSAIGSVVGSTLLVHGSAGGVFLLAAIMYALSGLIAMRLPSKELGESRRPNWGTGLRLSLKLPALQRAMLFAFLGWFLLTQLYSSLPLFVSTAVHRPELLGSVFALNAVLVVAGVLPLSKIIVRLRLPVSQLVLFGFLSFAGGFALLWFFPYWQVVYAAVVLWTLGEMLLTPALDTLVAEGALFEYKHIAFTLNTIAVGLGEAIGNFVGVALAGWLIRYGNVSYFYALFTLGAVGAMIVTTFAGDRRESMIHRLLRGQPLIPTGQTQSLLAVPAPFEEGGVTQALLTWLGASSLHEERSFLEMHPELVALDTGQLNDVMEQHTEQPEAQMLAYHLNMLREVRSRVTTMIRAAYINMHGGLVLDLPSWLEETKQQLFIMSKEGQPDQTALKRMTLLHRAIRRGRADRTIAPEILAELHVLYATACMEVPIPEHTRAIEAAIQACEAALQVYTLPQYPYQYARTQIFLSLAYQNRVEGERRDNLERAIACYKAALQGYTTSDPFPMQLAATQLTQSPVYAQHMGGEKRDHLEQAIACCQRTLQDYLRESSSREWAASQSTQLLSQSGTRSGKDRTASEEWDANESTLLLSRVSAKRGGGGASHVEWIATQSTRPFS